MRILISFLALLWLAPAHSLILNVDITPADGFVTIGQEVTMVMNLTNDSSDPRPGITSIITNDIDGLSFPAEVPSCELVVAQVNPPTSQISYVFFWRLEDLAPNETRRCEATFRIRTIPNGAIPVVFRNSGITLATVTFRAKPLVAVPSMTPAATGLLVMLSLFVLMRGQEKWLE